MKSAVSAFALLGTVAAGAVVGVIIQALQVSTQAPVFRSLAKMELKQEAESRVSIEDLMIELESAELARLAARRVQVIHAELRSTGAFIRARKRREDGLIYVLAEGPEPKLTMIFLNSLLDEFFIQRREQLGVSFPDVVVTERATAAIEHLNDWKLPVIAGMVLGGFAGGLIGLFMMRFSEIRNAAGPPPLPS